MSKLMWHSRPRLWILVSVSNCQFWQLWQFWQLPRTHFYSMGFVTAGKQESSRTATGVAGLLEFPPLAKN